MTDKHMHPVGDCPDCGTHEGCGTGPTPPLSPLSREEIEEVRRFHDRDNELGRRMRLICGMALRVPELEEELKLRIELREDAASSVIAALQAEVEELQRTNHYWIEESRRMASNSDYQRGKREEAEAEVERLREAAVGVSIAWMGSDGGGGGVESLSAAIDDLRAALTPTPEEK